LVKSGEKPIEPEVLISGADKQEFLINYVEEQERMAAIEAEIGDVRDTHKFSVWRAYSEEGRIFENFDWENYEGEATTASELFFENEEVYLRHATSTLEEMKQEALDAYKDDPSYENTGKLLEVQYIIESKIDVLRMAADGAGTELSPDLSQKPHVLVSEEVELAYYRERKQRLEVEEKLEVEASKEKAREVESVPAATTVSGVQVEATQEAIAEEPDKGYQKGINGGAYTIKVNAESNGQPIVSFHQDGSSIETPNGKAMPQVFGEAVSPDPDSIVSVDPKVAIVPMLPSDGEMQAEQSAMTPV